MVVPHLLALAAEALGHLLPKAAGVDELQLALAVGWFAIGEDPDIGRDAGVVELSVGRQMMASTRSFSRT